MKTIYETLEMNKIQEQLLHYCASTLGKDKIQSLQMFDDEEELHWIKLKKQCSLLNDLVDCH